ncbi:MAG TPA: hypothetical protein VMB51_07165 [Solirubrobacteraceae bacterium]|nr:hypothetical protein [Solirubrobacteraceae bacterium]
MGEPSFRRGSGASAAAALCLVVLGLLACAAPALALTQRGHVYGFSFGSEGEGAGQFRFGGAFKLSEGAGIAVDEASGDVFVVDRGNHRVQEFSETGAFVAAWGWGVSDGKEEYEVCTSGCHAGIAGTGKGALKEPGALAVDNSSGGTGMVYVGADGSAKRPDVQMFTAGGEKALGRLPVEEEGRLDGVATDRDGRVWLYRGEEEETGVIEGFTDTSHPVEVEPVLWSPLACPKPGFGVDAGGEAFYVDHELLTGEGECPAVVEREKEEEGEPAPDRYARPVVAGKLSVEEALNDEEPAIGALDAQKTSGVAVDEASTANTPLGEAASGDVYIDNENAITAFSASGALIQRFGAGQLERGAGIAIDSRTGNLYVIDAAADRVDVFEPEPVGKPVIDGVSACKAFSRAVCAEDLTPTSVRLSAQLDPEGLSSEYYFQYGTADCMTSPSSCVSTPSSARIIGAGFGDVPVDVEVTNLKPSTTYYYRIIARNREGEAEKGDSFASITTLPTSAGVLADGRAWEMVSPSEKDGSGLEPLAKEGSLIQAAGNGSAVTYVANGPVVAQPEGNRSPEPTQILSSRGAGGWSSQDIVTPHEKGEGIEADEPSEYRFFSEDLALSLVQPPGGKAEPFEAPPLAPGASEKTLYVRDDPPLEPEAAEDTMYAEAQADAGFRAPGYVPLITPVSDTANTRFGGQLEFLDATPNLSDVVFESGEVPLTAGSAPGLYEWEAGGHVQLVSVLPGQAPAFASELGYENVNVRNAVSDNGTRVFFWAEEAQLNEEGTETEGDEAPALYMRDTLRKETIQINAAQGVAEPVPAESEVAFQGASSDGSKVFFTDTAPLNSESRQHPVFGATDNPADLYECEIVEAEEKLSCDLKDLTPSASSGSAEVLNVAPGISEDGSSVYFVANGALTPDAEQGDCETETAPSSQEHCNLYLWRDGAITLIANLSNEDSGDWGSLKGPGRTGNHVEKRPDLADLTARVSPNGEYFAFMSDMPLTGYDNIDVNHQSESVRDQEVYLYAAGSKLLVCASCNTDGPSTGVLDTPHAGEGEGLLVDRREDWEGQYLAGSIPGWTPLGVDGAIRQPRYLSDAGRLFFDSPDQLVPQATNGKEDVYEYEPNHLGSCGVEDGCVSLISSGTAAQESAFLDASNDGDDAFFLTAQPLSAADHDTNFDVYDAHVCTPEAPCHSTEEHAEPRCESSQECSPGTFTQPSVSPPLSATVSGPGNTVKQQTPASPSIKARTKPKPPTRAQQLANALKQCHRDKDRRHRVMCEKRARKKYAHKTSAKKKAIKRTGKEKK